MNTENMIDITGSDLKEVVKSAYDLSSPQGLGILHFKEGSLTNEEAESFIKPHGNIALSLDYVNGRACKLTVWQDEEKLYIRDQWFDHSEDQLLQLIERIAA